MLFVSLFVPSSFVLFFFFKQKTAYEMRISDWSSDVCSSDLRAAGAGRHAHASLRRLRWQLPLVGAGGGRGTRSRWPRQRPVVPQFHRDEEIGRASCRERVGQYV